MTLKIGLATLKSPRRILKTRPRHGAVHGDAAGRGTPNVARIDPATYHVKGVDPDSSMAAFDTQAARVGSVYVSESAALIPSGWYEIMEPVGVESPGGSVTRRPWTLLLQTQPAPFVTRQAENENVAGTDTPDSGADGGTKVVYTPTTSDVLVLDPRNVAGAEPVNLPAGTYRVVARVQSRTTSTQKYRFKTTKTDGTVITTGSQVTASAPDAWQTLDLGLFTIADADAGANWFTLWVQGVAAQLNDVWIDRIRIVMQ